MSTKGIHALIELNHFWLSPHPCDCIFHGRHVSHWPTCRVGTKVSNMTQTVRGHCDEIIHQKDSIIWKIIILNSSCNRNCIMPSLLSLNNKTYKKINHTKPVVKASVKTLQMSFYYSINWLPFFSASGGIKNDSKLTIYSFKNSDFHLL